jgi:hypothetical protein
MAAAREKLLVRQIELKLMRLKPRDRVRLMRLAYLLNLCARKSS